MANEPMATAEKTLQYAYRLWRAHRHSHKAWSVLIKAAIAPSRGAPPMLPQPAKVMEGVAVTLDMQNEEMAHVSIVSSDPDPRWYEFSVEDPQAKAVLGARVGDVIDFPAPYSIRKATVTELQLVESLAVTLCLERWEEYFPNHQFLQRLPLPELSELSSDEVHNALRPLIQLAAGRRKAVERAFEWYRTDSRVSPWMLSRVIHSTHYEVLECLAQSNALPVRCDCRQIQEVGASAVLSGRIVLDTASICTLARLNLIGEVASCVKLVAPQRTLDDIGAFVSMAVHPQACDHIVEQDGRVVWLEGHEQAKEALMKNLAVATQILEKQADLVEGVALARLARDKRVRLEEYCGGGDARSVAIAVEAKLLLASDDIVTSALAYKGFGISYTSTPGIIDILRESGRLQSDICIRALVQLHMWGYTNVPVHPHVIAESFRQSDWDAARQPAQSVLCAFSSPENDPIGLIRLALSTLRVVWREVPMTRHPSEMLAAILERIRERDDHRRILMGMLNKIDLSFGVDVLAGKEAKHAMSLWMKQNRIL